MDIQYEVLIIGSGPGGMTAAIYASRAGLNTAILESSAPGGKLVKTHLVENYPSYDSITGVDLAMKMHTHSLAFGAHYLYGDVVKVDKIEGGFMVHSATGETFSSKVVICATGTVERQLGLTHEDRLLGKGVSYCAVCDGAFYRDEHVVVIGGGNSALEESIYLTQFAKKVTIVMRRDVFRADKAAQDNVKRNSKIDILQHYIPQKFILDELGKVSGITIQHTKTEETLDLEAKAVFPYIGADPASSYLSHLGITDDEGFVLVNQEMETGIPGLYAIGDMTSKTLRQIVTATGDGSIAAQNAFKFLNS